MATIEQHELDSLRDAAEKLRALENGGVDNWDFYDEAMSSYNEAQDKKQYSYEVLDKIMEVLACGVYEPSERGAGIAFTADAIQEARNIIVKVNMKRN